jgi:hypothetical protein
MPATTASTSEESKSSAATDACCPPTTVKQRGCLALTREREDAPHLGHVSGAAAHPHYIGLETVERALEPAVELHVQQVHLVIARRAGHALEGQRLERHVAAEARVVVRRADEEHAHHQILCRSIQGARVGSISGSATSCRW